MAKGHSTQFSASEVLSRVFDSSDNTLAVGGSLGSSSTDGATFTSGSSTGTVMQGVYQATPTAVADGKAGAVGIDGIRNLKVTLATQLAGEDLTNGVFKSETRSSFISLSVSAAVKSAAGRLFGVFVTAASATPTIKLWDNTAASGTVLINTFTPVAATMYTFPGAEFNTGLYITISGTVDATVFYK